MEQIYYCHVDGPVGPFLVAGTDNALHFTGFSAIKAYFDGESVEFDFAISPKGTEFQMDVWNALRAIPYGQTASYGDIARVIGNPKAVRAVGAANRANHLPIIIPCHRVIGTDGSLTGFGGGLDTKKILLRLEGVEIKPEQADLFTTNSS